MVNRQRAEGGLSNEELNGGKELFGTTGSEKLSCPLEGSWKDQEMGSRGKYLRCHLTAPLKLAKNDQDGGRQQIFNTWREEFNDEAESEVSRRRNAMKVQKRERVPFYGPSSDSRYTRLAKQRGLFEEDFSVRKDNELAMNECGMEKKEVGCTATRRMFQSKRAWSALSTMRE